MPAVQVRPLEALGLREELDGEGVRGLELLRVGFGDGEFGVLDDHADSVHSRPANG
jgi:hypothetical protein